MTYSWPLNVIAPNFESGTVGGAGEVMVQLTNCFLRQHSNIKIYLNQSAARQFPQWSDHIIKIRTERSEYALDLLHHLPGLADNIVHQHDVASIIDWRLTTDKDHFPANDRLGRWHF